MADAQTRPTPKGRSGPTAEPADDMARYLSGLELDRLDLSHIELGSKHRGRAPLIAASLALVPSTGFLLWLPQSALYGLHSYGPTIFAGALTCEGALLVLVAWLWRRQPAADESTPPGAPPARGDEALLLALDDEDVPVPSGLSLLQDGAQRRLAGWQRRLRQHMRRLSPRLAALAERHRRRLLAGGLLACGLLLAFVLPQDAQWGGKTYSGLFFLAVLLALTAGILFGRLIIAAGEATPALSPEPRAPLQLPSRLRWLSLALLILGGLAATFGPSMVAETGPTTGFPFAGLGFAVGIALAIWLVRRFDEWERAWQDEARRTPRRDETYEADDEAENR